MTYISDNTVIKPLSFPVKIINIIKSELSAAQWTVFLESSSVDHVDSNWSIFTSDPIATLTESTDGTLFHDCLLNSYKDMGKDPLTAQTAIRQAFFHAETDNDFPFHGGAIAAYSYEMGELFESLHKTSKNTGLDIGAFHCGFYDWAILHNVHDDQFYLMQHRSKNRTEQLDILWETRFQWLSNLLIKQSTTEFDFKLTEAWQANTSEEQYQAAFNQVQEYILSGDCYQVNLAQRFQAPYVGSEYQAYQALLQDNKPPFAAFFVLPDQTIISVSPERFLLLKNQIIQTKPIKGTMPRSLSQAEDLANKQKLINSEKDQAENLMIVDLLRNDIGRVSEAGSVAVPKLFDIESFPAVHHLVSTVTGKLAEQYTTEDLLRACFPGGSITGAPKIRSMEVICELEKFQRQIYCGSIAYINGNGDMDSSITIRTLVCHQQKIYCWAGGGIVADSNAQSEYKECFDKVSKILPLLASLNQ
ncbi:aminodeoxychorismate synthase component I [Psychromonas sp. 14N.309.X.WAT.B.A12]|uniref:aminodeoxychorismate synthase component I n=1 Tax=unclassified Psychromonas TaxID=2614957 RepID=UPI0025B23B31|nr:aminodeoxychorismate synthase component I [Psychromonas sp. 14N.309.X.WAT.B.A12]MDN2662132.1 aminodeoxychorismate synthase component I [Psychromonas sp. 14N.309.X.WAT.B.A12]